MERGIKTYEFGGNLRCITSDGRNVNVADELNALERFKKTGLKMLIENLDAIPKQFTDGVRGIMLLYRNKDGGEGNAQRKSIKRISRSTEEWKVCVHELSYLQDTTHKNCGIYSSVNSRDITKAIHEFKRRQLEVDYGNLYEFHSFYCDIKNRFFSCLMNPNCRDQNNFLIDCDTKEEYEFAHLQLDNRIPILMEYKTKNGYHLITPAFNPNDCGPMQIKKDDLLFIG